MSLWRLRKKEEIVIRQAKPLVLRRVDDRWTLVEETRTNQDRLVIDVEEQSDQQDQS